MKKIFFGRENYLDLLNRRVSGFRDSYRQNMAIIGDELVGKTSLIFRFMDTFNDNRIIFVFMDARLESVASFSRRFIGVLLYNFLNNSGIPLKEDLDYLILKADKFIPLTTEKIRVILRGVGKGKVIGVFPELMALCESIHAETGKFSVVIFDEFQNLEEVGFKNFYRDWSKLLLTNKNTMYIILSSMKFKAKEILGKNLSLLFGNFEVIAVEPFDIEESCDYLIDRLQGLSLPEAYSDFIVNFTGGCPMYLDIIADRLLRDNGVSLSHALEDILFDASGILHQRFSNYMKRFSPPKSSGDYLPILYLISSGRNKIKDIAHLLTKNKTRLLSRINYLLEIDTISRCGDFLKINDRVFGFWIKFVYQEKLRSLTFDAKSQKDKFRDQIEGMIQEYMVSAQKPLMERMGELFGLFEDEILQVDKKKVRLNHLREIKPLEFKNRVLKNGLIGRSNESLWIVAVKSDMLTEEDVIEFSKECRRYRHKLQRKVIVTLKEIDINTRLRALEEKVWAWDIDSLNQILDFYSRPRVIA